MSMHIQAASAWHPYYTTRLSWILLTGKNSKRRLIVPSRYPNYVHAGFSTCMCHPSPLPSVGDIQMAGAFQARAAGLSPADFPPPNRASSRPQRRAVAAAAGPPTRVQQTILKRAPTALAAGLAFKYR